MAESSTPYRTYLDLTRKLAVNFVVVPLAAKLRGVTSTASEVKKLYNEATDSIVHEAGIEEDK